MVTPFIQKDIFLSCRYGQIQNINEETVGLNIPPGDYNKNNTNIKQTQKAFYNFNVSD